MGAKQDSVKDDYDIKDKLQRRKEGQNDDMEVVRTEKEAMGKKERRRK